MILKFATGDEEEPILGFEPNLKTELPPAMVVESSDGQRSGNFLPFSNTCANMLNIPRPDGVNVPPISSQNDERMLFEKYDMSFLSNFFGKR